MAKFKKSQMVKAAKELNEVLGLEPEINVKGNYDELKDSITEAIELIDLEIDEFTDATMEVLEQFGLEIEEEKEVVPEPELENETEQEEEEKPEPQEVQHMEPKITENKIMGKSGNEKIKDKEKNKQEQKELSNKAIVYLAWKDGETKSDVLHKQVDGAVKITTIKSWMNQWKRDKNLPAIAKKIG